jgi:hypothetical protein
VKDTDRRNGWHKTGVNTAWNGKKIVTELIVSFAKERAWLWASANG